MVFGFSLTTPPRNRQDFTEHKFIDFLINQNETNNFGVDASGELKLAGADNLDEHLFSISGRRHSDGKSQWHQFGHHGVRNFWKYPKPDRIAEHHEWIQWRFICLSG